LGFEAIKASLPNKQKRFYGLKKVDLHFGLDLGYTEKTSGFRPLDLSKLARAVLFLFFETDSKQQWVLSIYYPITFDASDHWWSRWHQV
jgi:hypothetical protein